MQSHRALTAMEQQKNAANLNYEAAEIFTQNYWVFGLFPSFGILGNRKYDV
jgi:hypothetical protein